MSSDKYFSEKSIETLLGIRFNNTKEWYAEHKNEYKEFVHDPMVNLAQNIYEKIKNVHKDFNDTPRVCRILRDIRYSSNKQLYKDSKWFFLREGKISMIEYPKPNYFFELKAEKYIYGLGFWAKPSHMELFRKNAVANPAALKSVMDLIDAQDIFTLEGEVYAKKHINDMDEPYKNWYIRKSFTFINYREIDDLIFSPKLADKIAEDLLSIYPVYDYFSKIVQG